MAKRYPAAELRVFHHAAAYTQGRRTRKSRDIRALARGSVHGRAVAAGLWKIELAALARETGLAITVCHLPPGTSKWNKIEVRHEASPLPGGVEGPHPWPVAAGR